MISAAVGGVALVVPMLRAGSSKAVLILNIAVSLVLPLAWLTLEAPGGPTRLRWRRFLELGLTPFAVLLLGAAVLTRRCDLPSGVAMVLVGVIPALLAAFGLVSVAESTPRPRLLYLLIWTGLLGFAGWWVLDNPVLRTSHPLIGPLLASFYERPEILVPRAGWFAIETTAWGIALVGLARGRRGGAARWVWISAAAAVLLTALGPRFGHRLGRSQIEARLSDVSQRGELVHHFSPLVPTNLRPWILLEAEFQRSVQKELLQTESLPSATLYWYRDREESFEMTGASHRFANPRRGVISLHADAFPPRALGHELAHVSARTMVDNFLGVPGRLGGLWYNPALTEGVAEALAFAEEPLSVHETTRIALKASRVPPLSELFSPLAFLTHNLSVSYSVSGSFLRYCLDTRGLPATRTWLSTLDFEGAYGVPIEQVEQEWRAWLDSLPPLREDVSWVHRWQRRPALAAEDCEPAESWRAFDAARLSLADGEVVRLSDGFDNADAWMARAEYEAARRGWSGPALTAPHSLDEFQAARLEILNALLAWGRGDAEEAADRFARLPEASRNDPDVVLARNLLRDGYPVTVVRPAPSVTPVLYWSELLDEAEHPLVRVLLARRLRQADRWSSLLSALAPLTETASLRDYEFMEGATGRLPASAYAWEGQAWFATRRFDRAADSFRKYRDSITTSGRQAFAKEWIARTEWFAARAAELSGDIPALPRPGSNRACECPR